MSAMESDLEGVALMRDEGRKGDVGIGGGRRASGSFSAANVKSSFAKYRSVFGGVLVLIIIVALLQGIVLGTVLVICAGSILVTLYLVQWMLEQDEGDDQMRSISSAIREGSNSFFRRVYGTIFRLSLPMAITIFLIYYFREPPSQSSGSNALPNANTPTPEKGIGHNALAAITAVSFLLGAGCSSLAGYAGLWVSVRANVRVSAAAVRSYRGAVQLALRAGAVAALIVISLVVLGVTLLFTLFATMYVGEDVKVTEIPLLLIGYGFGASFVALFAQLGGGIFTKAADVGADLVGKVEQDIPEDDPRNPAVIADLVGDNVGDCSARGADLFESIAAEIISAMILGGTMATQCGMSDAEAHGFILFPLVIHAFDLVVSTIGVFSVGGTDANPSGNPGSDVDPLTILKGGYMRAILCAIVGFAGATRWLLYAEKAPNAWVHFFGCGMIGMVSAYIQVLITQYYTDYIYRPVKSIAEASTAGHATNVIAGLAVGMESTMAPVVTISMAILGSYWLGNTSGLEDAQGHATGGLFGTAVATMGMLSTAGYVLAMDIFGPIADNAGGIVEMSAQPARVRDITDRLDAVGNTTKAATKGYAIGSAALACFLLFSAFMDEISMYTSTPFSVVDIAIPEVFVGGLLGAALVFLFSSMAMSAVGSSASAVVNEVRRQFKEIPGIMSGEAKPQYGVCVDVVSKAALQKMVKPGLLAVLLPISTGLIFRYVGEAKGNRLMGAQALASFLMFATVVGILMALFLNNAGGAWDNTKKLVETGKFGGKGSDAHKAAVTGDTVGDPSKDTAGPSIHVLIKLLSTVTLVLCPLFIGSK